MIKKITALILTAFAVASLAACSGAKTVNKEQVFYSFTDDASNHIILEHKPQKVAVLFSSFAEIWTIAGGEIYATVYESVERGFADEKTLLVDSGAGKTINTELLISYEPDFVICSADIAAQVQTAQLLNSTGIPAAQFRVEAFDDYLKMLKICTDITGNEESYSKNGKAIEAEIKNLISAPTSDTPKKILFVRAGSSAKSTKAKTAEDHFAAAMLKQLDTHNIAENAPVLLDGLSIEEILTENPEYIFITSMGDENAAKQNMDTTLSLPEWQSLEAVKSGRVYFLPKDLFQFKPNARWAEAYAYLAEILNEK